MIIDMSGRLIAGALTGYWCAFVIFMAYWIGAEAAEVGRQYSNPVLRCAFCALIIGAPIGGLVAVAVKRD